jgi:pimeloyl-ACP methyl ester carboxylesterase
MMNGLLQERMLQDDPLQPYFLYVPSTGGMGKKLFVTVHGISRNAHQHAEMFMRIAEKYDVVLVAPFFSQDRFPDYGSLGFTGRGMRSDHALEKIVAEVRELTGTDTSLLYLFGYSGGGQFAHRFTMAYPGRVARVVVGAAGWYTFPEQALDYPQGVRSIPELTDVELEPEQFLKVPVCVLVGELDTERTDNLNQNPEIDAQQGTNRVERGRRWEQSMRMAAEARGFSTKYHYRTLPDSAHSFAQCMEQGGMGPLVFNFLFDANEK